MAWVTSLTILEGLNDLCMSYEVGIRLHGTKGTQPVNHTHLKYMQPASECQISDDNEPICDALLSAKESGYQHKFQEHIKNASYTSTTSQNSISVSWNNIENGCFEGYLVELRRNTGESVVKSLVESYSTKKTFFDLDPCLEYVASVTTFMGLDENKQPIFVDKLPYVFSFTCR